jgi:phosphohistidine phosphatase
VLVELYLIRHAEAAPAGEGGIVDDAERPLTETGRQQARSLARILTGKNIHFDAVLCSPLLRAKETAEEFVQSLPPPAPPLKICDHLAPGGKRQRLARSLEKLGFFKVALVGHQPDLEYFAAWLIGSRKAQIVLEKAGIAYIPCYEKVMKGQGTLGWLLTPEWLGF